MLAFTWFQENSKAPVGRNDKLYLRTDGLADSVDQDYDHF